MALPLMIAAAGAQFGMSWLSASARKKQAMAEARLMDLNAKFIDMQERDATERGVRQSEAHLGKTKMLMGEQRVALAAQGIDITVGNAADIQEETAVFAQQDAQNIRNNAWREAWGFRAQAAETRGRAAISRAGAKAEFKMSMLGAGINAGSSMASSYAKYGGGGGGGGKTNVRSDDSGWGTQGSALVGGRGSTYASSSYGSYGSMA